MTDLVYPVPAYALGQYEVRVAKAEARFYDMGTLTPRTVYADVSLETPHPVPLVADENGVFPPIFTGGGSAIKVDMTDPATGLSLPGYPMEPAFVTNITSGAANITFSPTPEIPANNVQAAIEAVQANLDNVSALAAALGFAAGPGWTRLPPAPGQVLGTLFQWGAGTTDANGVLVVTFPVPWSAASWVIQGFPRTFTTARFAGERADLGRSNTNGHIQIRDAAGNGFPNVTVQWFAVGT
jgi:hypothetical protein